MFELERTPHRRYNPLTRDWVLVSPQRTERPWQGQVESAFSEVQPEYDPDCYLCPGNPRAGGARNPLYSDTYVFDNDFPALEPATGRNSVDKGSLMVARSERGVCRVVCFSPRHDLSLPRMELHHIRGVVDAWVDQLGALGELSFVRYVQIFENRGAMMGCSNPHPHCQIWASESVPNEALKEDASQREYRRIEGSCLLCDYLQLERGEGHRIVCENDHFAALAPFWAVWPFETLLISRRHVQGLDELDSGERTALAVLLKQLTSCYDALFNVVFPYSMGFHQRPTHGTGHDAWHLHAHYYPPLLRSATVRKFIVGYEMLATPQRDLTAEEAAARLREVLARP